jgi:hypothetical protein
MKDAEKTFGSLAGATLIDAYTPLTLRDWVDSPEGSPYGILRSMRQLPVAATLHRLAPAGLFFAGQNALSPGVLGTLLGSFQAVRQLIGPGGTQKVRLDHAGRLRLYIPISNGSPERFLTNRGTAPLL